jgi:hypothetical protein
MLLCLPVLGLALFANASGVSTWDVAEAVTSTKQCAAGSVRAVVAGKQVCLKSGQRCRKSLDRQYHRYGFHCHTGRLVRIRPVPKPRFVTIEASGQPETVFSWTKDRCDDLDIPDLPARAFRDAQGRAQLLAAHFINRRFVGPDLDSLTRECSPILRSDFNSDPSAYDDHDWLASTYSSDGHTVYALIHDEYQGFEHPGQCTNFTDVRWCLRTSITFAVSHDDGSTYQQTSPPALVASFPSRYAADSGHAGAGIPSNIVHNARDGYYYAFLNLKQEKPGQPLTVNHDCLIRTKDLADPRSWRAWSGGTSFDTTFIDPYRSTADPDAHLCKGVAADVLGDFVPGSLTFNTVANQWLFVGISGGGFFYSLSPDLIHWTGRNLFYPATVPWTYMCGGPDPVHDPSLIDPTSSSRNFDTSGATAYVYFTLFHTQSCQQGLNRDLMRVPIQIRAS